MSSLNKAQQMKNNGKGSEHENLGEVCLLDQSQGELPSLPIESEIQSRGHLMVYVDDKGVGSYPLSREEITLVVEVSREDMKEVLIADKEIEQISQQ
ncbi:hypothetical protein K7X08_027718 [Anisodus acutangulus]|uniref:Uncharacterized protein n=1 Tax=Anisodus acutangulus TaxID=402998 RepID=A0A9Q1R3P4_9SOLA|nr:hypothetical protein K7X08_027718 [Anisodus acutangulus]